MEPEVAQQFLDWQQFHKEEMLYGRYITIKEIEPILQQLAAPFQVVQLGLSFEKRPIYKVTIGSGAVKVLLWSQMHGNEATGTKALFDLFKFLKSDSQKVFVDEILTKCTLVFIPMLNPDGAEAYTRVNAQNIDLNRDAVALKALESNLLRKVLTAEKPQFCFNLHDQRTIFSVGLQKLPATLSFLAPSIDEERTLTAGRKTTMAVIAFMYETLKNHIPKQIGRYTDEFYPTATGDNFQKLGHHTILIEAGHFKDDYQREKVRSFNFLALLVGLQCIARGVELDIYKAYFEIPNNEKKYLDSIYKNVNLAGATGKVDVGILFKEELIDGEIAFIPTVSSQGDLSNFNANTKIDFCDKKISIDDLLKN